MQHKGLNLRASKERSASAVLRPQEDGRGRCVGSHGQWSGHARAQEGPRKCQKREVEHGPVQVRLNGCPLHTVKPDILRVKAHVLITDGFI